MASTQYAPGTNSRAAERPTPLGSSPTHESQRERVKLWVLKDFCTVLVASVLSGLLFRALHAIILPGFAGLGISFEKVAELFGLFFFSLVFISYRNNLYKADAMASYLHEQRLMVQASLMSGLIAAGSLYLIHASEVPRSLVLIALVLSTTLLCGHRMVQRYVRQSNRMAGIGVRHIMIVGSEPEAGAVKRHIGNLRHLGLAVKGFVALPSRAQQVDQDLIENIFEDAQAKFIDEIFLVNPHQAGIAQQMLALAREHEIDLRIVPDLYDGLAWNRGTEYVGQFPTIPLHRGRIPELSLFLKRTLDLMVSLAGLTLGAIPMAIIALLIKLDSPGPVFYHSERVGLKGRKIQCTKFRTMIPNADRKLAEIMHLNERNEVLFKISNDPRITRIGRFLRKYSLDELPQLFDVLRGDMSIVGPRPPIASEVRQYKLSHLRRLEVTPGITGLWQVQARRDPSFDSYVSLDMAYIENWSVWLDLKIMVRTIGVVLSGTGS